MMFRASLAASLALAAFGGGAAAAPAANAVKPGPASARAAELSSSAEIVRRFLTPIQYEAAVRELAAKGQGLAPQPLNPAGERFAIRVPAARPAAGYGVLVFVPPWREARLPPGWGPVLDRFGLIYVSAANSGNEANVVSRRAPLALLGYAAAADRYPIDPSRVYVGGFSGGSRVALRVALEYADLFTGALLNAGSDPIGTAGSSPPEPRLWELFATRTRLVLVTGSTDEQAKAMDRETLASFRRYCVGEPVAQTTASTGHQVASPEALAKALTALGGAATADPGRFAACRAAQEKAIADKLAAAQGLIAKGQASAAREAILEIDRLYGGLAAPRTVELAEACGCGLLAKRRP